MKRIKLFTAVLMIVSIILAACGEETEGKASGDGEQQVSVILKALNEEYWKIVERGALDAGEEYGVEVVVNAPASETEVERQVSMIQDQHTNGTDALVLAPAQPSAVLTVLDDYTRTDTPVVLLDSDADYEEKVSFVGTENYSAGQMGGEYIASLLEAGDQVAIIRGQLGSTTHDERTEGAEEAMKEAGLDIVAIQAADSDKEKALNVMENLIQSNPNIKAVFTSSELMALGALRGVEASGKDIIVVGFDGTTEGLESVKEGGINAEVAQDPYQMGYLGVEAAIKALKKEEVEARIDSGADVVTQDKAEEALNKIKEYTGK